jgi:hypothetical protein
MWLPLVGALLILVVPISLTWKAAKQDRSRQGEAGIELHNERIYKDFEFYIKVFLALGAALGYVQLESNADPPLISEFTLLIAGAGLITMWAIAMSGASHQASKILRWKTVDFKHVWRWQETWLLLGMFFLAAGMWLWAACRYIS